MPRELSSFLVQGFPQDILPEPWTLDEVWVHWWAAATGPIRLLSLGHPFDVEAVAARLRLTRQRLLARANAAAPLAAAVKEWHPILTPSLLKAETERLPSDLRSEALRRIAGRWADARAWEVLLNDWGGAMWRIRWLDEYAKRAELRAGTPMWSMSHYLLADLPPSGHEMFARQAARVFETGVEAAPLPSILEGPYIEERDHLRPERAGHLHWTFLQGYQVYGRWTTDTLHALLQLPQNVALCIDTDVVPMEQAELVTELARQRATQAGDKRAERTKDAADEMQEVLGREQLHRIRIVVGVAGQDVDDLRMRVAEVERTLMGKLKLARVEGAQAELQKFFTPTPTSLISTPIPAFQLPSMAAAELIPFGVKKPDATEGIEWVRQGDIPLHLDPFPRRQAAHMVVLGKTTMGKTNAVWCWATRLMAEMGAQVIVFEPQGHSRRLVAATAPHGGERYVLSAHERVNILDVAVTGDEEGRPPSITAQVQHVVTLLGILLGTQKVVGADDVEVTPYVFTPFQEGVLDAALERLYAPYDLVTLHPSETPILSDLVDMLLVVADTATDAEIVPVARELASLLRLKFVHGSKRETYNGRTTIDWSFVHQCTAYDFSAIPKGVDQMFWYIQSFAAVNRFIRSPERSRDTPLIVIIDEFKNMARIPSVMEFARRAATSWRTFGAHIWTMDQTAQTYLGTVRGQTTEAAMGFFLNTTLKVVFQQDPIPATQLGEAIPGLRPHHVAAISKLRRGQALFWWQAAEGHRPLIAIGDVVRSPREAMMFEGT